VTDPLDFLLGPPIRGPLRPDPVPEDALDRILAVASRTGSSGNRRPWEFIVVRARDTLARLAELAPEARHLADGGAGIVIVMPGGQVALDAFDEGRVTERILLAARAQGLAARVGWVLADQREAVRELLGIPADRLVRTTIALGLPEHAAGATLPG
jgi:nitroreductase